MTKRIVLASFLILIVWILADALLHEHFLSPYYQQNESLWRPVAQMNIPLAFFARFALLGAFVATYVWLVRPRSLNTGLAFGALTGLTLGVAVGLGTYLHSPIPLVLAWGWFWAAVIKSLAAGLIVGLVLREMPQNA